MMMGMMMPGAGAGGGGLQPSLPVNEDLKDVILEAEERKLRAIKVVIDKKRPRLLLEDQLAASDAFDEDFRKIDFATWLEDGHAAIVLIRTSDAKGVIEGAQKNTFLFLMWMPQGVPVRQKATFSSAMSSFRQALDNITFKEWNVSEREEVNLQGAINIGRELTDAERLDGMTAAERASAEAELESQKHWREYEKNKARSAKLLDSFEKCLLEVMDDGGKAIKGKLAGYPDDDTVELTGDIFVEDLNSVEEFRGKLAQDEVAIVVLKPADTSFVVIHWNPEGAPEDQQLKGPSAVRSLVKTLQERYENFSVATAEASNDAMLTDNLLP